MQQGQERLGDILHAALNRNGGGERAEYYQPDAHDDSIYPHLTRRELEMMVYALTDRNRASKRIQRGFNRAGIAVGGIPVLTGIGLLLYRILESEPVTMLGLAIGVGLFSALAVGLYAIFALVGWILSGFFK